MIYLTTLYNPNMWWDKDASLNQSEYLFINSNLGNILWFLLGIVNILIKYA